MKTKCFLFLSLFTLMVTFSFGQKKPLDEDSYLQWRRVDNYNISQNGRWVIYRYSYLKNREKNDEIKNQFYLFDNVTKKTDTLINVENPQFCGNGGWLVGSGNYLLRLKDKKKISWNGETPPQFTGNDEIVTYTSGAGRHFVAMNIVKGDSIVYENAMSCNLYDNSKKIVYLDEDNEGVKLKCGSLFNKKTHKCIFVDTTKMLRRFNVALKSGEGTFEIGNRYYRFNLTSGAVILLLDAGKLSMGDSLSIDKSSIKFCNNDSIVLFELLPSSSKSRVGGVVKEDKEFGLELWSWNDVEAQSVQAISPSYDRTNPSKYAWNRVNNRYVKLCDEDYLSIHFPNTNSSNFAFICDEGSHDNCPDWRHDKRMDVYSLDLKTAFRRLVVEGTTHLPQWTPAGNFILYFDSQSRAWYSYDPRSDVNKNLTKEINSSFYDMEYDRPNPAGSYGVAAFTTDGRDVLLYDRYDIWVVSIDGNRKPYCLTGGYGKANNCSIRLLNPNSDLKMVDLKEEHEVELFDLNNMNKGFYTLTITGKMIKNFEGPYFVKINKVSSDSKTYLYQRQSFTDDRDLWISDSKFKHNYKITDANAQQVNYKWGSVELFEWTNYDGKSNRGLLYLPDDYKKGKSYPTIVSFYETHTEKRYVYQAPTYSSAMIDIATYVSNGYIVFQPDVNFTIGKPGESSYNAVVSGTKALIEQGFIDKDRIGLQGHSWSGYQVAYLVTKTDMFKCVNIGAAVVNMTSSYNGIRDGSGMPRMFMYEDWQCRMGKKLWDDKRGYIDNSPIFFAENINTPALIFHCDNDEAVSYSEGRSLFLALRRLGKPAWLLNYRGEGHFLSSMWALSDWTKRMAQFYDYYLKNSDKPRWLEEGITSKERAVDKKLDLIKK